MLLVDAENAFIEINGKAFLHNINVIYLDFHLCAQLLSQTIALVCYWKSRNIVNRSNDARQSSYNGGICYGSYSADADDS